MKEWWQNFFVPVTGEIMFTPKASISKTEVEYVLERTSPPKHARILDLACGFGRHAIEFAKRDFEVVGLDFSKPYLAQAKKAASKAQAKINFVNGDMKNLRAHFQPETFDLVVSLYNSFGYFNKRSDDRRMVREVYRVLKPGGKFVLNTLNGAEAKKALIKPVSTGREPLKNVFMIDAARFDVAKSQTKAEWTIIDARRPKAKIHRMKFQQNVYTHQQLKNLLREAGFKIESTWGPLHGGEFDSSKTWHQTLVCKK